MSAATVLTDRFDRALLYATHVHGGQVRKETTIPYIAHLLAVAATSGVWRLGRHGNRRAFA
jgi:(p)ppGpp synthase/HD superfamily hydrolase